MAKRTNTGSPDWRRTTSVGLMAAAFLTFLAFSAGRPTNGAPRVRLIASRLVYEADRAVPLRVEIRSGKEVSLDRLWKAFERPLLLSAAGGRLLQVAPLRLPKALPAVLAPDKTLAFDLDLLPSFPGLAFPGSYRLRLGEFAHVAIRIIPAGFDAGKVKRVEFVTTQGIIVIRTAKSDAPANVDALLRLAASHAFDGLVLDRFLPKRFLAMETMPVQLRLPLENPYARHTSGAVGMMRRRGDPRSAVGSLYFSLEPMPRLDGNFTILACLEEPPITEIPDLVGARIITTYLQP